MTPLQIGRQEDIRSVRRFFFTGRSTHMALRQLQERERKRLERRRNIRNGLVFAVLFWAVVFGVGWWVG